MGLGLVLGGAALLYLLTRKKDKGPMDLQLSRNFRLSEFLRSQAMPSLALYEPSPSELANVKTLVTKVLQPLRNRFGRLTINHGGRPPLSTPEGKTFVAALKAQGWQPAKGSDHERFAAADIRLANQALMGAAFEALKANPNVRQVIAYRKPGKGINRLHVSVKHPGHMSKARVFAFVKDDKVPAYA